MRCAMARAWMSVCPPAANGTMMRIGLAGNRKLLRVRGGGQHEAERGRECAQDEAAAHGPSQGLCRRSLAGFVTCTVPWRVSLACDGLLAGQPLHTFRIMRCGNQSILAPDAFTTSAHLVRSPSMNFANSSGVIGDATAPISTASPSRRAARGCASISAAILSTIGFGVPAGANTPCQEVASKPGMVSATVGTSGAIGAALGRRHGERAQPAGLHLRPGERDVVEGEIDVAAGQVVHDVAGGAERHVGHAWCRS